MLFFGAAGWDCWEDFFLAGSTANLRSGSAWATLPKRVAPQSKNSGSTMAVKRSPRFINPVKNRITCMTISVIRSDMASFTENLLLSTLLEFLTDRNPTTASQIPTAIKQIPIPFRSPLPTPAFSRSSTYSAVPLSASRAVIKKLIPYMIVEVMAENIRKIPPNIRHILPFIACRVTFILSNWSIIKPSSLFCKPTKTQF